MSLTTVTHFEPLDPPPGGHFISKSFDLLKEFDAFSQTHQFYLMNLMLFGLGWPLGASGALGSPLETFSGALWPHLWSWKLSGVLFGCICVLFGLLLLLFDIPWDHIF